MKIKNIDLNNILSDLFETKYNEICAQYRDENGEVDAKDTLSVIEISNDTIALYLRCGAVTYECIPQQLLPIFETSVNHITVEDTGYAIQTDICTLIKNFKAFEIKVEGI